MYTRPTMFTPTKADNTFTTCPVLIHSYQTTPPLVNTIGVLPSGTLHEVACVQLELEFLPSKYAYHSLFDTPLRKAWQRTLTGANWLFGGLLNGRGRGEEQGWRGGRGGRREGRAGEEEGMGLWYIVSLRWLKVIDHSLKVITLNLLSSESTPNHWLYLLCCYLFVHSQLIESVQVPWYNDGANFWEQLELFVTCVCVLFSICMYMCVLCVCMWVFVCVLYMCMWVFVCVCVRCIEAMWNKMAMASTLAGPLKWMQRDSRKVANDSAPKLVHNWVGIRERRQNSSGCIPAYLLWCVEQVQQRCHQVVDGQSV